MILLSPTQLCWLLLAIPIVLCYLRLRRGGQWPVSTTRFWEQALAERGAWTRWRRSVSLFVTLTIVGLLVVGLADPAMRGDVESGRTLVVIVDVSASMKATDVNPSRFELARRHARRLVAGRGRFDSMAIWTAGSTVKIVCGRTSDMRRLAHTVETLQPTDGGDSMATAAAVARQLTTGHPGGRIAVISDGCFSDAAALAGSPQIDWYGVGGAGDNVAVTRLEARPRLDNPTLYETLIEVANFSSREVRRTLRVGIEGGELHREAVTLAAGANQRRLIPVDGRQGGLLVAQLDGRDALAADDRAQTVVAPRVPLPVVLVSAPGSPLVAALRAVPWVELTTRSALPTTAADDAVAILDGRVPERLPDGPLLVIAPENDCDLWKRTATVELSGAEVTQTADSATADVDLASLVLQRAIVYDFSRPATAWVASDDGTAILSLISRETGPVLVWHVRLTETDLAWREAFPQWIVATLRWLGARGAAPSNSATTNQLVEIPPAGEPRELVAPNNRSQRIPVDVPALRAPDEAGLWTVRAEARDGDDPASTEAVLGSSLLNHRESDLRPAAGLPRTVEAPPARSGRSLRLYLIVAAVVLLSGQQLLIERKVLV